MTNVLDLQEEEKKEPAESTSSSSHSHPVSRKPFFLCFLVSFTMADSIEFAKALLQKVSE